MTGRGGWLAALGFLTIGTSYAVAAQGGDAPYPFAVTLLCIGLAGLIASVARFITIRPLARAIRCVSSLAPTSTICA